MAAPRRVSVGFQGGQVLALRVSDEQLKTLYKSLGSDRLARAGDRGWPRAPRPRAGRVRARRGGRPARRLRRLAGFGAVRSLDERVLRVARTRGHGPRRERVVSRFSRLGEHGAVWIAIGAAGWALDRPRRPQWARASGVVVATFALNTALKLLDPPATPHAARTAPA